MYYAFIFKLGKLRVNGNLAVKIGVICPGESRDDDE